MKQYPIHIAFCANNAFVPYTTVTIKSIVENHKDTYVTIHIVIDKLDKHSSVLLKSVTEAYGNIHLEIHETDDSALQGLFTGAWTVYAWYRILLPSILPEDIHRVLYLNADVVVAENLSPLFQIDMTNKSLAAAVDLNAFINETYIICKYDKSKLYVCSGVLLLNMDFWREHQLKDKIIRFAQENGSNLVYPDQDSINHVCQDSKYLLPLRYGIIGYMFQAETFYKEPYKKELTECIDRPAIIHYGGDAPWVIEYARHPMQHVWEQYNNMLHYKVKRRFRAKGLQRIKMQLYKILHPKHTYCRMTIEDIRKKLSDNDS